MFIAGIDPGQTGAVCLRDTNSNSIKLMPLPFVDGELDMIELNEIFFSFIGKSKSYYAKHFHNGLIKFYLEKAQAMPKNGVVSMFKYGRNFGRIEGVISGLNLPYRLIHPKTWTKVMHEGCDSKMDAKNKSLTAAKRLFPGINFKRTERCKKDDEGFIDALLISEYAFRKERGNA